MGLLYSKPLEIAFNSLSPFFNLDWSTEWKPAPKTFPLFCLPLLPLVEVFKSLDPIELFILSKCSRKVTNCVHIVGSKKWKLSVEVGNKCIQINKNCRVYLIQTAQKPFWKYDENLDLWLFGYQKSENSKLELQKVLCQFQNVFKCPVTSFEHSHWMRSDQCWVSVLNYITHNRIQPLESFGICGIYKKKDLEWALQNVRVSRKMDIYLHNMPNFTTNFRPECEQFTFVSSYPLCLDFMTFKSCKYLELSLSLTMHDLDVFMKEWKAGKFPNLQYIGVGRIRFDSYGDILGFKKPDMSQRGIRRSLVIDKKKSVECTGGVDIQSENGTKATMQMNRKSGDWFELFILSQCSRRIANCVHIAGTKKWKLSVDVGKKRIKINNKYRLLIIETSQKPSWRYDEDLDTLLCKSQKSENSKLELQEVLSRLQAAFRCPVTSFASTDWRESDQNWLLIVKSIAKNQIQPLESLHLRGRFKSEDLKWVLENVKVSRNIEIYSHAMPDFTTNFHPICEIIKFFSRDNLRLDLMKFKSCKYIELSPFLTLHDLDVFMKEWKAGGFPNLQYMGIRNSHSNWVDGILGFRKTEMSQSRVRRRLVIDENLSAECTGGVDIQSDNGKKATMYMGGGPSALNSLSLFFNLDWSTEWPPAAKTFPLFRLPFLAWLEVFRSLDPIELFILSQCSKRVRNCVHIVGTKKWKLSVYVGSKCIVINGKYKLFIIETTQKPSWRYDKEVGAFFMKYEDIGDSKLELQDVLAQLQTAFRCPNQTQPLESLNIEGTVKKKHLDWTLQNVRVTRIISIRLFGMLKFTGNFQPICERFAFFSTGTLGLDLMMLKSCKLIELKISRLTMRALNFFMKEWKAGSFPNLRYILIQSGRFNWRDHILGFDRYDMEELGVSRRLVIDKNLSIESTGGVDIHADNGRKATMQMSKGSPDWFRLIVWED
ncbi:unnamed protein product [Caenorhabditis brenneri]